MPSSLLYRRKPMFKPRRKRAKRGIFLKTLVALGCLLVLGHIAYISAIRPWHVRWGATDSEVARELPGDDLVSNPVTETTRAITIAAPRAKVWPWIVQMGQGKGGMYSYEFLENVAGCKMKNAHTVLPRFQHPRAGKDTVALGPKGYPSYDIAEVSAPRAFVLRGDQPAVKSTWVFYLTEQPSGNTRLIVRSRTWWKDSFRDNAVWGLTERIAFVMERKMLLTIRARAEGR